jgi:hypothetical protein
MTTTRAAQLEAQARKSIAARSTEQLCYDFNATESQAGASREIAMVRGWLMDELEKRDAEAFDAWMFSDESLPHSFYGVAPAQLI